ncbi:YkgB family protein [Lysobacter sp. S4-A87]|uniref:DUF417 family protein n=1 Tax=Lysobacter sp. S4-A87 TaxID=2925843 RepID=UPI001F53C95A|nr:DUF417 family protein [Lysobacter sp. S4-A87]UNK48645.1 YkgB family protein [Lysobacter sp. S4-A87]
MRHPIDNIGDRVWAFAARLLGLIMVWFGAMRLMPFGIEAMARQLAAFPGGVPEAWVPVLACAAGGIELLTGLVLLVAPACRWRMWAGLVAMVIWGIGLLPLSGASAWVHAAPYDGFPVIGSGQTLLKHVGIAALGLGIFARQFGSAGGLRTARVGLWLGQLVVLTWIGLMKFTLIEAEGVEGLMRSSPLFSWLYRFFDVQGASNVIGAIELATAALILLWPWQPRIARWGLAMAAATYLLTNTFLVTLPGWQPDLGFPFVAGTGQFLLKDLLLLAGALVLMSPPRWQPAMARRTS